MTKRVAVCRPGPFVLTLALFGPEVLLDGLLPAFATFRDALEIVD